MHFAYKLRPNEPEAETLRAGAPAPRALRALLSQRVAHRLHTQPLSAGPLE